MRLYPPRTTWNGLVIPPSITINLTWDEVGPIAHAGCTRNINGLSNRRKPGAGAGLTDSWTKNIEGCCAEAAIAKWRNLYWSVGMFRAGDVWGYQSRCNMSRRLDDTILRPPFPEEDFPGDDPEKIYIGSLSWIGLNGRADIEIMGWVQGKEVMIEGAEWFRAGTPGRPWAWWVPRERLHPLSTLPEVNEDGSLVDGTSVIPPARVKFSEMAK